MCNIGGKPQSEQTWLLYPHSLHIHVFENEYILPSNACLCVRAFVYSLFGLCIHMYIILPDISAVNRFIHSNVSIYERRWWWWYKAKVVNEPDQILILFSTSSSFLYQFQCHFIRMYPPFRWIHTQNDTKIKRNKAFQSLNEFEVICIPIAFIGPNLWFSHPNERISNYFE